MPSRALHVVVAVLVATCAACSIGPSYQFDEASKLTDAANALNTESAALVKDASEKYAAIYAEAQKADDPFEELANKEADLKKLEPPLASAKTKLGEAAGKFDEAAKLNVPDWHKQYLTSLADFNRAAAEVADLFAQEVKNAYDTTITSPEDLDAKQKALDDKIAAAQKRMADFKATQTKIESEHKENFKG